MVDKEARTTSRSKTRPFPVVHKNIIAAFFFKCKGY